MKSLLSRLAAAKAAGGHRPARPPAKAWTTVLGAALVAYGLYLVQRYHADLGDQVDETERRLAELVDETEIAARRLQAIRDEQRRATGPKQSGPQMATNRPPGVAGEQGAAEPSDAP